MAIAREYKITLDQLDGADPLPPEVIQQRLGEAIQGSFLTMSVEMKQEGGRPPGPMPDISAAIVEAAQTIEQGLSRLANAVDNSRP